MDEIAADFTEYILMDEATLRQFINDHVKDKNKRNVAQRLSDSIRNFINKVKSIFKGNKAAMDEATVNEFGATVAELEKAEKLWKDALQAAQEKVNEAQQGKAETTKVSDNTNVVRFSHKKSMDSSADSNYNKYRWAIDNNLLSQQESAVSFENIAALKRGEKFRKTFDGYCMIPVGENGINNTIIITDGKYNKPSIENVIKINSYNETDLASYREDIYESKSGMRTSVGEIVRMYEEEGILTEYKRSDIWMFEEISSEVKGKNSKNNRSNRNNSGQQNGRGSSGESKRFSLKDRIVNQLKDAGLNVLTYKQNDEQSRLEAVNSVEGASFSLKGTDNILKENEKLKKQNDYLKSQMKLTTEYRVNQSQLERLTRKSIKHKQGNHPALDCRQTGFSCGWSALLPMAKAAQAQSHLSLRCTG